MTERPVDHPIDLADTTVAFAGAGRITVVHGLAVEAVPGVTVTSVASRSPESAAERAGQLHARTCTYDELPDGADVVLVATPPARHAADALHAIAAGARVIVEKPLTTTLTDADALVAASAAAGHAVGYAENLAFAPVVMAAVMMTRELGPLRHLEARSLQPRPDWGGFLDADWGGGALFDLGVHPLAVVLLLAGVSARNGADGGPRVTGVRARLEGADDIAADEYAEVEVVLDTGLVANVVTSWRHPEAQWDLQAAGDTGVVRADLIPHLTLERDGEPVPVAAVPPSGAVPQVHQYGYVAQLRDLLADFAGGVEPAIGAEFGRFVLELVCAAYQSAGRDGELVDLPFAGPRDRTPLQLWRDGADA